MALTRNYGPFPDEIVVLKDALHGERRGIPQDLEFMVHGSGIDDWEDRLYQEKQYLDKVYGHIDAGESLTLADRIFSVLLEAIPNFQFHGNKNDTRVPLYVHRWRDDTRVYYSIHGQGSFNPKLVRTNVENEDGSIFQGKRRSAGTVVNGLGGMGHVVMTANSTFLAYNPDGSGMYIIVQVPESKQKAA